MNWRAYPQRSKTGEVFLSILYSLSCLSVSAILFPVSARSQLYAVGDSVETLLIPRDSEGKWLATTERDSLFHVHTSYLLLAGELGGGLVSSRGDLIKSVFWKKNFPSQSDATQFATALRRLCTSRYGEPKTVSVLPRSQYTEWYRNENQTQTSSNSNPEVIIIESSDTEVSFFFGPI